MTDTAVVPANSAAPAVPDSTDEMVGMEDFDQSDVVMPRIKIVANEGVFEDTLTGEKFDKLENIVVIGLVKGRIMWGPEVEEKAKPHCRSLNHTEGRPGEDFPWKESGFTLDPNLEQQLLACESCPFKEFGTHPTRPKAPRCAEQHTYVIGLPNHDQTVFAPAIVTFQSSGIKPSKAFISGYMRDRKPMFINFTTISLDLQRKGTVTFSVPKFEKGASTDVSLHPSFAAQYRTTRTFLHTPRSREEEEEVEGAGVAAQGATAPAPRQAPADDEMPF